MLPRAFSLHRLTLALLLALLAPGSSLAEKKVEAPKPEAPAEAAPKAEAKAKHLLWKVSDKEGHHAWLLGSIHMSDGSLFPMADPIKDAFADSEIIGVEVNVLKAQSPENQALMQKHASYSDGTQLSDHLPKKLYRRLVQHAEVAGMPERAILQSKPWVVAITLMSVALRAQGIRSDLGIEHYFLRRAQERGMPVVELEGMENQLKLFDSFSDKAQADFVRYTLADMDDLESQIDALMGAWKTGDDEAILKFQEDALKDAPQIKDIMFDRRNKSMAKTVQGYVKTGKTHFVVVGAGHMVGKKGMIRLLEKAGYSIERF